MAMQPLMDDEPEQQRARLELERLIDDIHGSAERVQTLVQSQPALQDVIRERTLRDILPILLGPAGQPCLTCGGSGRR